MNGLAVTLAVQGRRCVVVGGGGAGRRKAQSLARAGADVVIIDPDPSVGTVIERLARGADATPVTHWPRAWKVGDSDGALITVAATADRATNERIAAAAAAAGSLVLRADRPVEGDLRLPATHRAGRVTVAIDTGGANPTLAAVLRDRVARHDDQWAEMADWAAEHRPVSAEEIERRYPERSPVSRREGEPSP